MRRSLRLLLEGEGYHCAEAGDGREAVERARRQAPDCVLLDIVMPGLDGLTVARTLRLDPLTRAAHIHCLTGLTDPRVRQSALEAGCECFLTKPVDPDDVLQAVRSSARPGGSDSVSGLTLAQAEELLDWLENQGCTQLRAELADGGVTVACICPPGLRLARDQAGAVRLQGG